MIIKDYYKILGFETSKVNIEQIKIAYRELAKKYHPDVNTGNQKAEERFKDIGEAYNTLSNPKQRRKYDRMWQYYIGKNTKTNRNNTKIKDLFGMFFGEKTEIKKETPTKKQPEKGENIYTEITATLTEAYYGATKEITFKTIDGGNKKINVKIQAGIRNKEKIRLIGQGKQGKNGGKNGDLFIKIEIKNTAGLKLEGVDIYTDLLISPWESALSTKVKVHGIDEEIEVDIPKGIQSGEKVILQNRGYKDGKGGRGDLVAVVKIMMPQTVSDEEIKLLKKLKEISKFNPRMKKA